MKTSEMLIGGAALFLGYKVLTAKTEPSGSGGGTGFSLGGISLGGLGGSLPDINLGGLGGGGSDIGGILGALFGAMGKGVTGDLGGDAIDAITKAGKDALANITGAKDSMTGELADAWQQLADKFKNILPEGKGIPENVIPKLPKVIDPDSPDLTTSAPAIIEGLRGASSDILGIWGRQLAGAALSGEHLIRPLPGAGVFEKLAKPVSELTENVVVKVVEKVGPKIGLKVGGAAAGRLATRAIPIVGWGLLLVDLGADYARLQGLNVPEFLGLTPIASDVAQLLGKNPSGENIFEKWIKKNTPEKASPYYKDFDPTAVSDRVTPQQKYLPAPYRINNKEAATGAPEKPTLDEKGRSIKYGAPSTNPPPAPKNEYEYLMHWGY